VAEPVRLSVRLVVLDGGGRVLLLKHEDAYPADPANEGPTTYWATPGGGVETGESLEEAAHRELWEETGLRAASIGACLWIRRGGSLRRNGAIEGYDERYLLVVPASTDVHGEHRLPEERGVLTEHRWWTVEGLSATAEAVFPPGLAGLLVPVVGGRVPAAPIDLG